MAALSFGPLRAIDCRKWSGNWQGSLIRIRFRSIPLQFQVQRIPSINRSTSNICWYYSASSTGLVLPGSVITTNRIKITFQSQGQNPAYQVCGIFNKKLSYMASNSLKELNNRLNTSFLHRSMAPSYGTKGATMSISGSGYRRLAVTYLDLSICATAESNTFHFYCVWFLTCRY